MKFFIIVKKYLQKKYFCLLLILLFALVTRISRLDFPAAYYFDEIHHLTAAKLSLNSDSRFYEWWHRPVEKDYYFDWLHPPLVKYIQALSISLLGQNAWAWRLPSVFFGLLVISLAYFFSLIIFRRRRLALICCLLLSLDGLMLVQSRIAMNDIFVTFFILLSSFFYYLKIFPQPAIVKKIRLIFFKNYRLKKAELLIQNIFLILTGISLGLALASKWTAFFLLVIFIFNEGSSLWLTKRKRNNLPLTFFALIVIPLMIYLLSFWQIFYQGKNLKFIYHLHQQIFWYQSHRDRDHPYASAAWQWFFNEKAVLYWPSPQLLSKSKQQAKIEAFANPAIIYLGIVVVIFTSCQVIKIMRRLKTVPINFAALPQPAAKVAYLLIVYFSVWLPWVGSPRIMFLYHYTPAMPFLIILIAYYLNLIIQKQRAYLVMIYLMICVFSFIYFYPVWTGLSVHIF